MANPTNPRWLTISRRVLSAIALAWVLSAQATWAAEAPVTYTVDLRDQATHLVRMTMSIPNVRAATEIQFPAWNALYQIRDFVRNVQELEARCDGKEETLLRVDLQTWRSDEQACDILELRYRVYANEESVFSSVLSDQHAFLNFAMLCFYLPNERGRPVRVKFVLPEGWKVATMLADSPSPDEFTAADYDVLADSPAEAGEFKEYSYEQDDATYRVIVDAPGVDYSANRLLDSLKKITATETALIEDAPTPRYTFILHFPRQGTGGMEHRNGAAISFAGTDLKTNWPGLESALAHEFFHAWDVKRIRPQALEPIDYVHGNDTRDLWFCEGLASTYQELVLLRAGLLSRDTFYERLAGEIRTLQERPARHFQSVELAGREAWIEKYPDYYRPDRSISYYNKGALVGFLLDLAIRHASDNAHSLDDVMRRLNVDFARRGRFFTRQDLLAIIAELSPGFRELHGFFNDYVSGTRELDFETYLGYAGLRLVAHTQQRAAPGFLAVWGFEGPARVESIEPGSGAEAAGLERGDVLLEMNGQRLRGTPDDAIARMKPGQEVRFRVRRDEREFTLKFPLGAQGRIRYRIEETKNAGALARRVRQGWLEGTTSQGTGAGKP
ncbi:MAG: PDZ domain-containing protein [Acidobacteriia bacterium]|nr:PDZ domain-containing protein [Terriglobia bacterium]